MDKQKFVKYGCKKFYNIGPWREVGDAYQHSSSQKTRGKKILATQAGMGY